MFLHPSRGRSRNVNYSASQIRMLGKPEAVLQYRVVRSYIVIVDLLLHGCWIDYCFARSSTKCRQHLTCSIVVRKHIWHRSRGMELCSAQIFELVCKGIENLTLVPTFSKINRRGPATAKPAWGFPCLDHHLDEQVQHGRAILFRWARDISDHSFAGS